MKRKASREDSLRLDEQALLPTKNRKYQMIQSETLDPEDESNEETSSLIDDGVDQQFPFLPDDDDSLSDKEHTSSNDDDGDHEIHHNDAATNEQQDQNRLDIPLGQLLQMKQDGRTSAAAAKARASKQKHTSAYKRDDRHKPAEMSSKKPVSIFRDSFQAASSVPGSSSSKREIRDPRFETLTGGKFSDAAFKKRYSFIYDEKLPEERKELKDSLRKTKSENRKGELKAQLSRVTQQIKTEQARRKERELEKKVMQQHKERTSGLLAHSDGHGNGAAAVADKKYYLKKSEKKKHMLLAKYEELKQSGQLDKYMEKRRKKIASKDHRLVPRARRDDTAVE